MLRYLWRHFKKSMKSERGTFAALALTTTGVVGTTAGLGAAASAGYGLSKLFGGGGDEVSQEQMAPAWQTALQKQLAGMYSSNLSSYDPAASYGGTLSAGATSQETQSLEILQKYLDSANTGELFGAGKQQILDTLAGKYANPETSPYIQSQTALAGQNLQDSINQSRLGAGARGNYYSTAAMRGEGDLRERTQNTLNSIIGTFLQNERQNQLGAATTAQSMDQYENVTTPLAKVAAAQSYGSLNRILEQADLDRQYNEWSRKQTSQQTTAQNAQGLATTNIPYGIMNWEKSGSGGIGSLLSGLLGNKNVTGAISGGLDSILGSLLGNIGGVTT
jgi:hypothetical protein